MHRGNGFIYRLAVTLRFDGSLRQVFKRLCGNAQLRLQQAFNRLGQLRQALHGGRIVRREPLFRKPCIALGDRTEYAIQIGDAHVGGFRDFTLDALCIQPDALHLGQAVNIARLQVSDVAQMLAHRGQILGGDVLHPFLEQRKQRFKLALGQHYSSPSCGGWVGDRDEIN